MPEDEGGRIRPPSPRMRWEDEATARQLRASGPPPGAVPAEQGGAPASIGGGGQSANRCVRLRPPIPSKFWGDEDKAKDASIPEFHCLVNFPDYLPKNRPQAAAAASVAIADGRNPILTPHSLLPVPSCPPGMRRCVMCGELCSCGGAGAGGGGVLSSPPAARPPGGSGESSSVGGSALKGDGPVSGETPPSYGNGASVENVPSSAAPPRESSTSSSSRVIPRQNKGLCTSCDVSIWVLTDGSGLEIKWCKGCKNFRPWAAFGDKGLATKCMRCRERQREKYAAQRDDLKRRRRMQAQAQHEEDLRRRRKEEEGGGPKENGDNEGRESEGENEEGAESAEASVAAVKKIKVSSSKSSSPDGGPTVGLSGVATGLSHLLAAASSYADDG